MRVIREGRRGCGERKKGGVYLVSEKGDGILPPFVYIEPPVPFEGEHFRGAVQIDLDKILEGAPEEEWLVDESKARWDKALLRSTEIEKWGMTLEEREELGMPEDLHIVNIHRLGAHLRLMAELNLGKVQGEIPKAFEAIQGGDLQQVLACLWRLWSNCPPKQRMHVRAHVQLAMESLNAVRDAQAVMMESL